MNLEAAQQTFLNESRELLVDMEAALLELENNPGDADLVNAVFRAAHTIKGTAGVFSYDAVEAFTHVMENVLDRVRAGALALDGDLAALLLEAGDHIGSLVETVVAGEPPDAALEGVGRGLLERLRVYLDETPPALVVAGNPVGGSPEEESGPRAANPCWHLSLRFGEEVLKNGMDPLSFLRYLGRMGEIVRLESLFDALPELERMDPELCYYGCELDLESDAGREEIEAAFEFVRDDCRLEILSPKAPLAAYRALVEAVPEERERMRALLVGGSLDASEWERMFSEADAPVRVQPAEREGSGVASAGGEAKSAARAARAARQIRIDAGKLDQLVNQVGELVIAGATTRLQAQHQGDAKLMESISVMSRLVEEIRDSALRLRMVPIGESFNRFQRVVRDVSRDLGKEIRLEISGGDTELDKTMIEKIGDPLMHLVRNAMDHGIESAEERRAVGKPAAGTLNLNAYHDSGSIVIEVRDDGRGLDRERLLTKAQEKGLITDGQGLGDEEIYRLIFAPGFSTAEAVTNLSGRGVGMDVVKRNIEALRGSVDVESTPGVGTVLRIRLPLTLAIIDGFLVGVGESAYVIPLDTVVECIELSEEERRDSLRHSYINLRGEVLPFLRLRELFAEQTGPASRENIVVVQYGPYKAGLVVDELKGEFQTVIKPLGKIFQHLKGVSGATILGSGEVAVILEVAKLVQIASEEARQGGHAVVSTTLH